jgi:hypothetical protein
MEKKALYPSQMNTKTISCRISAQDYVVFLNDAITKGISLNDWLLMKIYGNKTNNSISGTDNIQEIALFLELMNLDNYMDLDYMKSQNIELNSVEGLKYAFESMIESIDYFREHIRRNDFKLINNNENKKPNIIVIKAQILTLAKDKFTSQKDVKEFMKDVSELLKEMD